MTNKDKAFNRKLGRFVVVATACTLLATFAVAGVVIIHPPKNAKITKSGTFTQHSELITYTPNTGFGGRDSVTISHNGMRTQVVPMGQTTLSFDGEGLQEFIVPCRLQVNADGTHYLECGEPLQ